MLEAIRASGTWNVTAVVTRYFGGVLLGAGGLVRAYSSSVSEALAALPRVLLVPRDILEVELDPADAGRIEAELRGAGAAVVDAQWAGRVRLAVGVDPALREAFDAVLARASRGVAKFRHVDTRRVEVDAADG